MKLSSNIDVTGKYNVYHLEEQVDELMKIDKNKPSARIVRTKSGRKAIAALKDIELNHNHSWYKELKNRSKNNLDDIALFYRGTEITFREMFEKADILAKSFKEAGIEASDEIPVCISNTPELVYIMLAANKIGAKINCFGSHFNKEYLSKILGGCTNKLFIASDDVYGDIKDIVETKSIKNKVLVSLADSLPVDPKLCKEYVSELDEYYHYENKVPYYQQNSDIKSFDEFMTIGKNSSLEVVDDNHLDTEFLVTYTSGSTVTGFPKQIIHANRSLITMGIFHDPELSGNPKIPGLRGLAHIHAESNTNLITCISDNLIQGWSVALEPEYSKEKALDYVILNKPNYLNMTTSFIIEMAKQYLIEKRYEGTKLPFLLATFAVGEGTSKGEEKFINKFLRKSRAGSGVKIMGLSLPFTTLSVGGGDCEHGGIYYTLWKSLYEKMYSFRLKKREYGMKPVPFAHVTALKKNKDGLYEECDYNEYGIIVANSAASMVGYKDNIEAMKKKVIVDIHGREWLSADVYGYIDELGGAHVKGRVGKELNIDDKKVQPFIIEDVIAKDTKNILSCTVTSASLNDSDLAIANIEFQPDKEVSDKTALISTMKRCKKELPYGISNLLVYRIFNNKESFKLTGSGKRSLPEIYALGLKDIIAVEDEELALKGKEKVKVYKK